MKLAVLSESPADEAAIAVLMQAVLRQKFTRVQPSLRARGWPSVAQVLPSIIRHLHFNTDTDGLVVVVDSDDSVVHTAAHDAPEYYHPMCRMCQLRAIFRQTMKKLPPAHGRDRVLRGVGIAVPAVEAWYLCGLEETVTEASWVAGQEEQRAPYTRRELKARTYGTERPTLQQETEIAVREAKRHAHDTRRLENDFPGFAALANELRAWPKNS
jgi:hypothetical protein